MTLAKFQIIIISHATLCKGYLDAVRLVLNSECKNIDTLSFTENMAIEEFERSLRKAIAGNETKKVVILSDIVGGTPTNVATKFIINDEILTVAGVNFPLLLELVLLQESGDEISQESLRKVIIDARSSLFCINDFLEGEK